VALSQPSPLPAVPRVLGRTPSKVPASSGTPGTEALGSDRRLAARMRARRRFAFVEFHSENPTYRTIQSID